MKEYIMNLIQNELFNTIHDSTSFMIIMYVGLTVIIPSIFIFTKLILLSIKTIEE